MKDRGKLPFEIEKNLIDDNLKRNIFVMVKQNIFH